LQGAVPLQKFDTAGKQGERRKATLQSLLVKWQILFLILVSFNFSYSTVFAESKNYGVVYPEIREPYRSVFESIITGIEQQAQDNNGNKVQRFSLEKTTDDHQLNNWIIDNNIDSLIALGRRSHNLTQLLTTKIPVATGAVLMSPALTDNNGIVLNPDPIMVFKQLQKLVPNVKHINVIYNPEKNSWLIKRAILAAKELNLHCNTYPVINLHQAAKQYRDILKQLNGTQNSIWLLNDNSVFDRNALFSLVLQEAWNRKFVVFSNNPAHVKRGVLFAMFPNNIQMGKSLFKLVNNSNSTPNTILTMHTLSDLLIAFNTRTAEHLQLIIPRQQRDKFNLVFPAQ
jgi:putative ABC transport system substrate-binding protein